MSPEFAWGMVALLGALSASVCCWVPATSTGWRAKLVVLVMVASCVPGQSSGFRMLDAAALVGAAMLSAVGARSGGRAEAVAHRGVGAVLMAGLLLLSTHDHLHASAAAAAATGPHEHGEASLVLSLAFLGAAYLLWSTRIAFSKAGGHPPMVSEGARLALRFEPALMGTSISAMAVMDALR